MKALPGLSTSSLYLEIGHSTLKALAGNDGLELPLERQENGRLTPACKERLTVTLREVASQNRWPLRQPAFCAIGARGVSLRRLTLPTTTKEEFDRLLLLQIESEFPLPPSELAWGCRRLSPDFPPPAGTTAGQELIVVAVKREVVEDYSEVLSSCGLKPVFTLGALARCGLCPQPPGAYGLLDIGRQHSELIAFEDNVPISLRILPWGGEDLTRSLAASLGLSREEAEKQKIRGSQPSASRGDLGAKIEGAWRTEIKALAGMIERQWAGKKLYVAGPSADLPDFPRWLAEALRDHVDCERVESHPGPGRSSAILGLKKCCEHDGANLPLIFEVPSTKVDPRSPRPARWKWAALAAVLALSSFSFRYAEAFILKPRLSRRLAEIRTYREKLPDIDRELSFLQYFQTNQPPYLEAVLAIANAAPPGTHVDSLTMNRRGDLALRGTMRDSSQAVDFRSKLIESGFFATVVVDEQNPTPDRQKLMVRLSAQWKPEGARESPTNESVRPKVDSMNLAGPELKSGAPPKVETGVPAAPGRPPPPAK